MIWEANEIDKIRVRKNETRGQILQNLQKDKDEIQILLILSKTLKRETRKPEETFAVQTLFCLVNSTIPKP